MLYLCIIKLKQMIIMMTQSELASIIEAQGENVKVDVIDIYELNDEDAVFCTFEWTDEQTAMSGTTAAVVYEDGTCFTCRDWQSHYPHSVGEADEYEWRDFANGKDGIVLNGLPRAL